MHLEFDMYKKSLKQPEFLDFHLPFGGKLRADNRWAILANLIPWDVVESHYLKNLTPSDQGARAKSARLAFGSLIIKERLSLPDEEVPQQIRENPYLQYFLGFECYIDKYPFHPSMLVYFRKRFDMDAINNINEEIVKKEWEAQKKKLEKLKKKDSRDSYPVQNKGKLLIDATCTPADIRYPTDLSLLNEAREKTEKIIDKLYEPHKGEMKKPRTYRRIARKNYLRIAKQKKAKAKKIRKAIGKQIRYVRRNLKHIDLMLTKESRNLLSAKELKDLDVIRQLYKQQLEMYENKTHRVNDRIVSISQPHIRPIVRGKANAPVEFGAKISLSVVNGFSYLEKLSWDAYNESVDLIPHIEKYYERFGYYPNSVHVDKIYRTRENIKYCKKHNIRISGPALGRPKIIDDPKERKQLKELQRKDERDRIPVEGKFGQGKRRFNLKKIMTKLPITSGSQIATIILVMNLEKLLKAIFLPFFVYSADFRENCKEKWYFVELQVKAA